MSTRFNNLVKLQKYVSNQTDSNSTLVSTPDQTLTGETKGPHNTDQTFTGETEGPLVCNNMQFSRRVELNRCASAMKKKYAELVAKSATSPIPVIPVPGQLALKQTVVENVIKPGPSVVSSFYESISGDPNYIYAAVILLTLLLVLIYTMLCSD